jgi:signal transduction histidine kinase
MSKPGTRILDPASAVYATKRDWRVWLRDARALVTQASWKQQLLLLLAVAIPLSIAGLFAAVQRAEVIAEAQGSARRSVVALEQHAANVLDAHSLMLRQIDILTHHRAWEQIKNDELLRLTLSGFSRELSLVAAIGITDSTGTVITSSLDAKADGVSVADRDYFAAHRTGAPVGIFVSEAFTGRASNTRQFALSIRRNLPSGEFGGVIFTTVPLEHFTDFWRGFTPSGGHLIPMVRPDGALIVRFPRVDSPQHLDSRGPFISHLTRARTGLYTAISQVDGVERINAYSQIKAYPLFISFSVETESVLQTWRRQVAGASAIAVTVAGLLVALWMAVVRQSRAQQTSAERWEATARELESEISRRRRAEESVREGAERISFEEQLIGIVSHDLRNPLNAISLNAAVLAERDELSSEDAQVVRRIQNATQRATRLIEDLLDFTQARLGGRIPVHARRMDFHDLLRSVLAELEPFFPGRIESALDAEGAHGMWDPDRLAQVLENLVINALKYGDNGSVRVSTWSTRDSLVFEVHNHGAPIPPEKVAAIFEPLQRAVEGSQPNPARSIGMGLFIVKHIVEAHGGSVTVNSTREGGTRFKVQLPRTG